MSKYSNAPTCCYLRVSTDKQELSMDLQLRHIRGYAEPRGLVLNDELIFSDPDVSGKIEFSKRRAASQMIDALKAKKAKHLIVYKLDRLGRKAVEVQNMFEYLTKKLGVTVHIMDIGGDSLSSDSPVTTLIVGVLSLCAQLELDTIRSRIKDAAKEKRIQGFAWGQVPYGKRGVPCPEMMSKTGRPSLRLVDQPEEIEWITKMVVWKTSGTGEGERPGPLGYGAIANKLNELHATKRCRLVNPTTGHRIPKREGSGWTKAHVYRILQGDLAKQISDELGLSLSNNHS